MSHGRGFGWLVTEDKAKSLDNRRPLHIPGFAFYCETCGMGHGKLTEAEDCCAKMVVKTSGFRRTGLESSIGG